jgi:hypothetical protein
MIEILIRYSVRTKPPFERLPNLMCAVHSAGSVAAEFCFCCEGNHSLSQAQGAPKATLTRGRHWCNCPVVAPVGAHVQSGLAMNRRFEGGR